MASGRLVLPLLECLSHDLPHWLCRAVAPENPVIFLNTDKVRIMATVLFSCFYLLSDKLYDCCSCEEKHLFTLSLTARRWVRKWWMWGEDMEQV